MEHKASWMDLSASETIICEPPLTKIVTDFDLEHCSITSIRSSVVPKCTSFISPHEPSFSGVISWNLGIIRAPVAIATNSMSTPPTQRTAGKLFYKRRWLASSSKPHWQSAIVAPLSFTFLTISIVFIIYQWNNLVLVFTVYDSHQRRLCSSCVWFLV